MNWSQKIYLNDKPLILTTNKDEYLLQNPPAAEYGMFAGASLNSFKQAIQLLERPGVSGAIIEDPQEAMIRAQLDQLYQPVDAAGGIAYNERGEILLIYRRGKWDLPKGKRDEGEQMEDCALREVKEETGLKTLTLGSKICDTYHIYSQYGADMLKRTAWYKMKATATDKLKPQKEEHIMEVRWVKEEDMWMFETNTYEAIREVLRVAGLKVKS